MWQSLFFSLIVASVVRGAIIPASEYSKVIVVSDMHGDAEALLMSLYSGYLQVSHDAQELPAHYDEFRDRFNRVIESQKQDYPPLWTQSKVAVVQMGDLVDRGKFSLKCLIIMRAIKPVIGFDVFQILGNHEVAPAIHRSVGYTKYRNPADDMDWESRHINRPDGLFNREIANRFHPVIRLDGGSNVAVSTLFVHAGFPMKLITLLESHNVHPNVLVATINTVIMKDLVSSTTSATALSQMYLREKTVFTTRRFDQHIPDCSFIERILRLFQVSRIVVGHMANHETHQVRSIRCPNIMDDNPVVLLTDIAASRYMGSFNNDRGKFSPGSVLFDIDSGKLDKLEAVYLNPRNLQLKASPLNGPPELIIPEIPPTQVRKVGGIILKETFGNIRTANGGYVLYVDNLTDISLVDALNHFNRLRDDPNDPCDFSLEFPDLFQTNLHDNLSIFVQSPESHLLRVEEIDAKVVDNMHKTLLRLHRGGLCVTRGFPQSTRMSVIQIFFATLFAISEDEKYVDFINYYRLRKCDPSFAKSEMKLFNHAFHDLLLPTGTGVQ